MGKATTDSERNLLLLSTFTGAGGLDLGLEAAGFSVVGCVEKNALARDTIRENRDDWPLLDPPDITELAETLSPEDLNLKVKELDLIAGGPPCQSFSKAAQWAKSGRAGLSGDCETAIDAFLMLTSKFAPKAVLIENVPGFIRGETDARPYLESFFEYLRDEKELDYSVEGKIVNAAHYGVPQRRKRAIIVAVRGEEDFNWPSPSHEQSPVRAWDALADVEPEEPPEPSGKWAGLIPTVPEGENYLWHTDRGGGRELFGYRTRFWSFLLRLAKDETSWTLPAQPGPATGPFHWEGRPLAIEERLRLQTFPAGWKLCGSEREKIKQIGNATPPLLAEVFGRAIAKYLGEDTPHDELKWEIERRETVPPPVEPEAVPEHYIQEYERSYDAHPGPGEGPAPVST